MSFSFPADTEMFHFSALSSRAYGFSTGYHGMTRGGFPHWGILGSGVVWHLPEAYRSLPRPSSTCGA